MNTRNTGDSMSAEETAQRVVDNTILTAVSRIGIPLFIGFFMVIVVPIGAWYLNSTAAEISDIHVKASAVDSRVTTLEANQRNGTERGLSFQSDTKTALGNLQAQQTTILEELAGINATLKSRNP